MTCTSPSPARPVARIPLLLAAALLGLPVAAANLVQNGSFENVTVSTTTVFSAAGVANWSNSPSFLEGDALVHPSWFTNGYLFPGVGVAGPLPQTSPDGGNFVFSDGNFFNSPIQQTITGLTPGNFYQVTFYQALVQDTEVNVTIPGPVTGHWTVSLGASTANSPFMTGNGATLTISPWAQHSLTLQAGAATEILSFLSVGTGDPPLVLLDGIVLAPVPVPEAGSLALMGLGGLLVAGVYRRTRWQRLAGRGA